MCATQKRENPFSFFLARLRENRIFTILSWLCAIFYPLCCYGAVEIFHFNSLSKTITFFLRHMHTVFFLWVVLTVLYAIVWLILKKAWRAMLSFYIMSLLLGAADYFKKAILGEYLYPWDFLQITNLKEVTGFVSISMPIKLVVLLILLFLLILPPLICHTSLGASWKIRLPLALALAALCVFSVSTPKRRQTLLNQNGLYLEDMALQASNYQANGFMGAFLINLLSCAIEKPAEYSEAAVKEILSPYEATEAGDNFSSPDIILVLSESFWDPATLPGVTFSEDPLKNYHAISQQEGVISGKFYTTGFGGGTVRPEFEVLTGLTTDYLPSGSIPYQYVSRQIESFPSLYGSYGYDTLAIHPYSSAFYFRKNAYPLLGFDALAFEEELAELPVETLRRGNQISDKTFVEDLIYYLKTADDPLFLFGISMEAHQPYEEKFEVTHIEVSSDDLTDEELYLLEQYTQCMADADEALAELVKAIDERERDTILIYFGDHLPTLGANYGAYVHSGMLHDVTRVSQEEKKLLQSTPFLVYANFDLEEGSLLHAGNDNEISSYLLMSAVSELIDGPRTSYQNFLLDFGETLPYYNVRLAMTPTEEESYWIESQKIITYDRLAGGNYSQKTEETN